MRRQWLPRGEFFISLFATQCCNSRGVRARHHPKCCNSYDGKDMSAVLLDDAGATPHDFLFFYGGVRAPVFFLFCFAVLFCARYIRAV